MQNKPRAVSYPIESVDSALRLLLILRDEVGPSALAVEGPASRGIGVVEASRRLRVAPSTAHRLLTMLVHHGFAVQDAAKRYHVGPAMTSAPSPKAPDLRALTRPTLERLNRALGETVHLMVLQGPSVRFVVGIEGAHADRIDSKEGMVLPAHTTAGGRALLAQLTRVELAALYPHGLPTLYAATVDSLPELHRQLAAVVRRGYAVSLDESERGIAGVAAPLRARGGAVRGAIAVALRSSRAQGTRLHQIGSMLVDEARALEDDLASVA
jgi:IclR family acetate operon transcriptional repressor